MCASGPGLWVVWKGLCFPISKMGMQMFVLPSLWGGGDLLGWPVEAVEFVALTIPLCFQKVVTNVFSMHTRVFS